MMKGDGTKRLCELKNSGGISASELIIQPCGSSFLSYIFHLFNPGPSCLKLMMSLVNVSVKL